MSTRFGKVLENLGRLPPSTEQAKKPQERGAASAAPGKAPRKVGRPPGKKSDPDYAQVTVYLRKDNHLAAKKRLPRRRQGVQRTCQRASYSLA